MANQLGGVIVALNNRPVQVDYFPPIILGCTAAQAKWLPLLVTDNGDGTGTLAGGGGGGGNVTIVGTTATGNTTSTTTNLSTGGPTTITAGKSSIEFLLSSDFVGTINGATVDNTGTIVVGVYRLDAPPWKPLASLSYTITAGSAILTVQI